MMKGRKIGTIAALATTTATVAMLSGLSAARADELQVNQQLLDQRVDQLAAGQFSGPSVIGTTDVNPNAGAPVTAGSFPRSILIPGTDTSIKIYGQITEITDYYLSGGNPNTSPQSTTIGTTGNLESIPLATTTGFGPGPGNPARARSNGIFLSSPKESRIGFETRTPTPYGEARTLMEFDWAGSTTFAPGANVTQISDSLVPRLRYGYGTLGGLLAGQATSNFSDPDANAETIDFGGPAGLPGIVRIPQIRYTMPAFWGASFSVSAETPHTSAAGMTVGVFASDTGAASATSPATATSVCPGTTTLTATCVPGNVPFATNPLKSTAPNLTAAYYLPQAWGHIDISGVLLPGLDVADGRFVSRSFIGYGGHIGFDVKPGWFGWVKDDIVGQFELGTGLGSYVNASTAASLQTNYLVAPTTAGFTTATAVGASSVLIKPVNEIGGQLGYQHWWMDNLRSTLVGGIMGINLNNAVVGATTSLNKELMTAHLNLIWNPVSFVDIGLEAFWGQRTAVTNMHATSSALINEFKFRF
jgi:Porin subfamily/DcaP outer membrane protein